MTDDMINITADPREKVPVTLVGVDYLITPPKLSFALRLAVQAKQAQANDPTLMMDATDSWVEKAFGKVQAAKVRKRLENENDDLDFPHIMKLMEIMMQRASGNPTSSS